MRVYIITSGSSYETEVDASPGDAASRAWRSITDGVPLKAGLVQSTGGATDARWTIVNREQVIAVREMSE